MFFLKYLFILIVCVSSIPALANDILFDSLQWRARVLVLTGERNDPLLVKQTRILNENIEGLRERSIAVIRFERDNIFEIEGLSDFNYRGRYDMNANLQRYYEGEMDSDNNEFSVVLFGKDGERKEVWKELEDAVSINAIFSVIDAMPMRQRGDFQ